MTVDTLTPSWSPRIFTPLENSYHVMIMKSLEKCAINYYLIIMMSRMNNEIMYDVNNLSVQSIDLIW